MGALQGSPTLIASVGVVRYKPVLLSTRTERGQLGLPAPIDTSTARDTLTLEVSSDHFCQMSRSTRLVLRSLGPSLRAGPRVSEPQEQEKAIRKPG